MRQDLFVGERPAPFGQLLLPLAAVEWLHLDAFHRSWIETASVDAVTVGVRPRHVERFDATGGAEQVLRSPGVERVGREGFLTLEQSKARLGHDEMQKSRLGADGAIAVGDFEPSRREHLESHPAAMTTAFVQDPGQTYFPVTAPA